MRDGTISLQHRVEPFLMPTTCCRTRLECVQVQRLCIGYIESLNVSTYNKSPFFYNTKMAVESNGGDIDLLNDETFGDGAVGKSGPQCADPYM